MVLVMVSAVSADVRRNENERDVPQMINFQAAVKDADGMPVNDSRIIEFRIYDALTGGTMHWSEIHYNVQITDGIFSVGLGDDSPFDSYLFDNTELFITFVMGGEEMSPRQELLAVPYAINAQNAQNASTADFAMFADEAMSIGGITAVDFVTQDNNGDVIVPGTMTANAFVGDGSGLTGLGNYDDLYVNKIGPDSITAVATSGALNLTNTYTAGRGLRILEAGDGVYIDSVRYDGMEIDYSGDNGIEITETGGSGVSVYNAGTPTTQHSSFVNNGFEVAGAAGNGLYVGQADVSGVYVKSASFTGVTVGSAGMPSTLTYGSDNSGFEVAGAEGNGLYVGQADLDGVYINSASDDGVYVGSAGDKGFAVDSSGDAGYYVSSAGGDGVNVYNAGTPSTQTTSTAKNGFEVAGAEGNGLYIGQADQAGVHVNSASTHGVFVASTGVDGVSIFSAGNNGVFVGDTGAEGVFISSAGDDGIYVFNAGNPSTQQASTSKNGFEVAGAEGNGLYVGQADATGVHVNSAGTDGIYVGTAIYDGLEINSTGDNGVEIVNCGGDGVFVSLAQGSGIDVYATYNGVTAYTNAASQEWGIYTNDKIHGSNITTRSLSTHVQNTGSESLEAGDIVCIAGGFAENVLGEGEVTVNVEKANSGNSSAVFGVVEYKVTIKEETDERNDGKTLKSFRYADGRVSSGDYLSVIVFGPADVKTDGRSNIKAGEKLTASDTGKTRSINQDDHWTIGILGKSLEDVSGKDTVKVFVNCK